MARLAGRDHDAADPAGRAPVRPDDRGIAIAAIVRDEAAYIEEWLAWHLALGATHAIVHDNDSTDDLRRVLRPYLAHGLVTLVDLPGRGRQLDAMAQAVAFATGRFAWLALIDVDELIVPTRDADLAAMLGRLGDADQVLLPMRELGYGGHREPPGELSFMAYTTAHETIPRYGDTDAVRMKAIVRPETVRAVRVHGCATRTRRTVDAAGRPVPERYRLPVGTPGTFDDGRINHYYTRSLAEFRRKQDRGSATGRSRRPDVPFDLPGVEDRAALRFEGRVRERLATLRALDPDPYRAGAPDGAAAEREDPFAHEAALTIANHLAGRPAAEARAAFRVEPLAGGTGAVVHAGERGVRPAPGDLARSVHVAWLVERLGGSVVHHRAAAADPAAVAGPLVLPGGIPGRTTCPVVAFALAASGPAAIVVRGPDGSAVTIPLDRAGDWVGIVEPGRQPGPDGPLTIEAPDGVRWIELLAIAHP